jgi:hypothetical protein
VLQWALAIDSLEEGQPGSGKSFGMQQRPDGDIEIDEKFWEQDFDIPSCTQCGGVLKPDVRILFLHLGVILLVNFKKNLAENYVLLSDLCGNFYK